MTLDQLCQREILSVSAEASVQKAAELMRTQHVGALALTDPDDPARVVGLVTDRDLVVNLLAQGRSPLTHHIGAFGSAHVWGVPGTASVQEAVRAMHQHGVRRLFVTQANGRLMGLLSVDDLLVAISDELGGLSEALRIGIDMESARTSPMFTPDDMSNSLYLAQHEP